MSIGSFAAGVQDAMLVTAPLVIVFVLFIAFMIGALPIPVGYDRGKVKWVTWCATGQHLHVVYWHGDGSGLQAIHPNEVSEE